jgi:hypothetical protein
MQVRFARHTERLEQIVRFYGDVLGLTRMVSGSCSFQSPGPPTRRA